GGPWPNGGLGVGLPELAVAMSRRPSPFTSPTATDRGWLPAGKWRASWKEPSPLPNSTLTLSLVPLATARSSTPSVLRSSTATEEGPNPVGKWRGVWKEASPLPPSTLTGAPPKIGGVTSEQAAPAPVPIHTLP